MKTTKVTGFVLVDGCVAVFEHPTTGIQFPAGTVEFGESALEAARREVNEEVGAEVEGGRVLGVLSGERTRRFVAWHLDEKPTLPEFCGTDGHLFRPFWLEFEAVEKTVHAAQRHWWEFAPSPWAPPPRFVRLEADTVALRAMVPADYEAMARWMADEKLVERIRGQQHRMSLEQVREHWGPMVRNEEPVHAAIIEVKGRPVGYLQYYPVTDSEEYGRQPGESWAMDLFVGEPELPETSVGKAATNLAIDYLTHDLEVHEVLQSSSVDTSNQTP